MAKLTALLALLCSMTPQRGISYITVGFSPDGRRLVTTGAGTALKIWDLPTRKEVLELAPRSSFGSRAMYLPDGRVLFAGDKDEKLRLFSATGGAGEVLDSYRETIPWTTLSANGKFLAYPADKAIEVRDLEKGTSLRKLKAEARPIWSCAFSPDAKKLAAVFNDRTACVWSLESGQELLKIETREQAFSIAWCPDGKTIACGSDSGVISFWDAEKGTWTSTRTHSGAVCGLAYNPDGKKLASVSDDGTTRIWDAASGNELRRMQGGRATVVFSPDGKTVAAGGHGEYRMVWIWDADTGQELAKLQIP